MKYKNLALKLAGLTFLFGSLSFSVNAMEGIKGYSSVEMSDLSDSNYNLFNDDDNLQPAPAMRLESNVKIKTKADLTAAFIDLLNSLGFRTYGYVFEKDFNNFVNMLDFEQFAEVVREAKEKVKQMLDAIKNNDLSRASELGRFLTDSWRERLSHLTNRAIEYEFPMFNPRFDSNSYAKFEKVLNAHYIKLKSAEQLIKNYAELLKDFDEDKASELGYKLELNNYKLNSGYEKIRAKFLEILKKLSNFKFISFNEWLYGSNFNLVDEVFVRALFGVFSAIKNGLNTALFEGRDVVFSGTECYCSNYEYKIEGPTSLKDIILNAGGKAVLNRQLDDILKTIGEFLDLCIENDYGNRAANMVLSHMDRLENKGSDVDLFEKAKAALRFELNVVKGSYSRNFQEDGRRLDVVEFPALSEAFELNKSELDMNCAFLEAMQNWLKVILSNKTESLANENVLGKCYTLLQEFLRKVNQGYSDSGNYVHFVVFEGDFGRIDAFTFKQLELLKDSLESFRNALQQYRREYLSIVDGNERRKDEGTLETKTSNKSYDYKEGTSKTKTFNESHDYDYEEGFYTDNSTYHLFS